MKLPRIFFGCVLARDDAGTVMQAAGFPDLDAQAMVSDVQRHRIVEWYLLPFKKWKAALAKPQLLSRGVS
jgi:hypothetical protein